MFNFIDSNNDNISNNAPFQFAKKHALNIYKYKAIYSFIPKNGCTTLRASLATTNGFIEKGHLSQKNINWVHNNTYTFSANLDELISCQYKFTVLRCPYDRLVSLFLDKFVDKTQVAWNFYKQSNNHHDLNYLTFSQFIDYLHGHPKIMNGNIHWRKQNDFLIYTHYDDYFNFDNFKHIEDSLLKKFPIQFVDARNITHHGRDKLKEINNKTYFESSCNELLNLKLNGFIPSTESMLSNKIKQQIDDLYYIDFELIKKTIHNPIK